MDQIGKVFIIKSDSIESPRRYLGTDVRKKIILPDKFLWILGPNTYLKEFLRTVGNDLQKFDIVLRSKATHPFSNIRYRPELDVSPLCNKTEVSLYQQLIGTLRWLIESGRLDISFETTL